VSDSIDRQTMALPRLSTRRLLLRPVGETDVPAVLAIGSDEEVTRWVFWPPHHTLEDSRRYIQFLEHRDIAGTGIVLPARDQLIGTLLFHGYVASHDRIEVAVNVAREHWGQGYATEALVAVTDHVLAHWPIHRVEATCMTGNTASARMLEKAGFQLEGVMRQSRCRRGVFHDMMLFARLHRGEREST
jgi:ribosomal-protein-alanine N-acetyltransferase